MHIQNFGPVLKIYYSLPASKLVLYSNNSEPFNRFSCNRKGLPGIAEEMEILPYERWLLDLQNVKAEQASRQSQVTLWLPRESLLWLSSLDNISESSPGSPCQIPNACKYITYLSCTDFYEQFLHVKPSNVKKQKM